MSENFDATECVECHAFGKELMDNGACEDCWLAMSESRMRDLVGDEEFERGAHEAGLVIKAALADYEWRKSGGGDP